MPKDDFSSSQKSPGGYGGSSGGQSGGSSGGAGAGRASNDSRNYAYKSSTQPSGTKSQGNWNTGGDLVATGNPSNMKPIPTKKPGSIAEAVSARPPVRKKIVPPPLRKKYIKGLFGGLPAWQNPARKFPSRYARDAVDVGDVIPDYGSYTPPGAAGVTTPKPPTGASLEKLTRADVNYPGDASSDPYTGTGLGKYTTKNYNKDQSQVGGSRRNAGQF